MVELNGSGYPVVWCGDCGLELDERSNVPVESRHPCPRCGSLHRSLRLEGNDSITISEAIGWKHETRKRTGGKTLVAKGIAGKMPSADGTLADVDRVLDVRRNRYRERVRLADGTVTRDVDEPLTEHRGRGSAKGQRGSGWRPPPNAPSGGQ